MARKIQLEIVGDSRSAERAFKRAGKAAHLFHRKLKKSTRSLGRSRARAVGRGAVRGAGAGGLLGGGALVAAGVGLGVSSVKAAAGFEKTMARIQGLAGQSQKQVATWSNQLLAMGPAFGKTPTELAEALYFIASSGVPASKAMSVLTASAKASAAGLGETEVVADAVTSVMNAYASSGMGAARATDVLVATVREGKGEADQFAGVIGNVAAFASRLNVPFEQVGAALAAMTQLGTDPATAATQLQAFFSQILRPSPKARKEAKKVGLSFKALGKTLQSKGLLPTLDLIKKKFKGNTTAMAQAFPNIRALRALLALTADDGGKVAGVFGRMAKSSGSLGSSFSAAQRTSAQNMAKFQAGIEALKIAFGQGLAPVVARVATVLAKKLADPAFIERVRELGTLVGTKLYKAFQAVSAWFSANWPGIQEGFRKAKEHLQTAYGVFQKIASFVPGGEGTLLQLIVGGVILSKLRLINRALLTAMGRLLMLGGAGGVLGGKGGKGGKGKGGRGKGGFLPLAGTGPLAIAGVLSQTPGATHRASAGDWAEAFQQHPALRNLLRRRARAIQGQAKLLPHEIAALQALGQPGTRGFNPGAAHRILLRHQAQRLADRRRTGRALGGPVAPGVMYRIGERGPENVMFGARGQVFPNGGGGGGSLVLPLILNGREVARAIVPDLQRLARQGAAQTRGRHGGHTLALS